MQRALPSRLSFSRLLMRCTRMRSDSSSRRTRVRVLRSASRPSWASYAAAFARSRCSRIRASFRRALAGPCRRQTAAEEAWL